MHVRPSFRCVSLAAVLSLLVIGCGTKPEAQLPGVWLLDGSGSKTIEFKPDGAVVLRARQRVEGLSARWTLIEPGKLTMTFTESGTELKEVVPFELKGDELTLKSPAANARGHYRRISADALAALPGAPPQPWVYDDQRGIKADERERSATAVSGELADGTTIALTIRERTGNGPAVLLNAGDERHAFACSAGCTFSIRFDEQPAVAYSLAPRRGESSHLVFFDDRAAVLARLKSAKRTSIETPLADENTKVYEFTTAGLVWP